MSLDQALAWFEAEEKVLIGVAKLAERGGLDPAFIDPGSPWQNGTCESFNGRFRDELLVCEQFNTLLEVQVLAEDWRIEYNAYRPHGSLGGPTPEAFHQQ